MAAMAYLSVDECISRAVDHASVPGGKTDPENHGIAAQVWATVAVAAALENVAEAIRESQLR